MSDCGILHFLWKNSFSTFFDVSIAWERISFNLDENYDGNALDSSGYLFITNFSSRLGPLSLSLSLRQLCIDDFVSAYNGQLLQKIMLKW